MDTKFPQQDQFPSMNEAMQHVQRSTLADGIAKVLAGVCMAGIVMALLVDVVDRVLA